MNAAGFRLDIFSLSGAKYQKVKIGKPYHGLFRRMKFRGTVWQQKRRKSKHWEGGRLQHDRNI